MSLSGESKPDLVVARQSQRPFRLTNRVLTVDGGNGITCFNSRRRGIAQIPNKTIHAGLVSQWRRRFEPVIGNRRWLLWPRRLLAGGKLAYEFSRAIENFQGYGVGRRRLQQVINHCSGRRILARRQLRRQ